MTYFIGIDVSTTATKALLCDDRGTVVAVASDEYAFDTPQPLWSEQHPSLWWDGAAVRSIRAVLSSGIDACSTWRHRPDRPDARARAPRRTRRACCARPSCGTTSARPPSATRSGPRVGAQRLIDITGNDALTGFTAPKILWVRKHEPEVYARVRHVLLPKDYVRYSLTGDYAMDCADGAGTMLVDLRARNWSDEVLAALDIPRAWMPPLFEGPAITGRLTAAAAEATGLKAGTPVVAGGGDQAAQAVGVGAVREGIVALTLGTSGVVFATTNEPRIEPQGRLHAFCHAVPGRWHLMGVMLSAAGSLRWYRDTFAPGPAVSRTARAGRRRGARLRRVAVPALPDRRAHPAPRSAGARRVRRTDGAAHPGAPHPRGARRRGLRAARRLRADEGCRAGRH